MFERGYDQAVPGVSPHRAINTVTTNFFELFWNSPIQLGVYRLDRSAGACQLVLLQGFCPYPFGARSQFYLLSRLSRREELGVATGEGFDLFKGCAAIRPN